jgi:hypothetical protein
MFVSETPFLQASTGRVQPGSGDLADTPLSPPGHGRSMSQANDLFPGGIG